MDEMTKTMNDKKKDIGALLAVVEQGMTELASIANILSVPQQQQVILMNSLLRKMRKDHPGEGGKRLVVYFGRCYLVPDWFHFIATDDDGDVFAHEAEPRYSNETGIWPGCHVLNIDYRSDIDAQSSLLEIPE